jgi:hypothetical protein
MMAQAKERQVQDAYAQQGKRLASLVQRLRGWVGSDPARAPELADALVELTAHRLLGHGYAAAAGDAQESVRRAGELLAANGPIGPYTSIPNAARYVTAVVHLATIQVGLGMTDAAGNTVESLQDVREQLREHRLEVPLQPQTLMWALWCSSRTAVASGDVGLANGYADAAIARWAESDLGNDPDAAYLAIDVAWLASDCRWAVGRAEEALSYLHVAKDHYDTVVGGRLDAPGRLSPALLERLAEPLFGMYQAMAKRLVAIGEVDLGLVTRRRLIDLLRGLTGRLGDTARAELAVALNDLARDLSTLGRRYEAEAANAEAATIMPQESTAIQDLDRGVVERGPLTTWSPLPASAAYGVTAAASVDMKIVDLAVLQRAWRQRTSTWLQVERPRAQRIESELVEQARIAAERQEAERIEAERVAAEQRAAERARAEEAERRDAEQRARADETERTERKRRREERLEAHRLEVERREAERREAERVEAERRAAKDLAEDPAESERLELERLQAEIDQLERAERMAREQDPPPAQS